MIVDVSVERGHHIRERRVDRGTFEFVTIEWVGVGLGDNADTGPARVAQHRDPRCRATECAAQQVVCCDRRPESGCVVSEFADFGCRFVDKRQHPIVDVNRLRLIHRIVSLGDQLVDGGVAEIEVVVVDEQVEPGRVPAAHLEPVDRRERLLYGEVSGQRRGGRVASGQRGDLLGGAQTVMAQRPEPVAPHDRVSAQAFGVGHRVVALFEIVVERVDRIVEHGEPGGDLTDQRVVVGEGHHAWHTTQEGVDRGHSRRRGARLSGGGDRLVETVEDNSLTRHLASSASRKHCNDAAHDDQVTDPGAPCGSTRSRPRRPHACRSGQVADRCGERLRRRRRVRRGSGLHHHPHQRLGAAGADEHPAGFAEAL